MRDTPREAVVVGAGLAGAAAAASLARRGIEVTVLDAADAPAQGASGLPAGLLAPHTSLDDNLLSRLTREGVRATLAECRRLLREGADWHATAVTRNDGTHLEPAAWIKPAALVRALLAQPGIDFRGGTQVASLTDVHSPLIVVAAAHGSQRLLGDAVSLHAVRGQIAWGEQHAGLVVPATPVNGNGHFIPSVPTATGLAWFSGSTYGRDDADASIRAADTLANIERLRALLPEFAKQVEHRDVHAWAGVRCTTDDRRPLVGQVADKVWVTTAMGSRGLTFCVLAGELLAARLLREPLPLDARLAAALDVARRAKNQS